MAGSSLLLGGKALREPSSGPEVGSSHSHPVMAQVEEELGFIPARGLGKPQWTAPAAGHHVSEQLGAHWKLHMMEKQKNHSSQFM